MTNKLINELLKKIPLETRVAVSIQHHFIMQNGGTTLMPLDENGDEIQEAVEANERCYKLAEPVIKSVLKDIEKWKKDGCP